MVDEGISSLEMRSIDVVLEMQSGYVLDFTDRTFTEFFRDHDVDIDAPRYRADGASKAKRLRSFLRTSPAPLVGTVLAALLEYRLAMSPVQATAEWSRCIEVALRLGGRPPAAGQHPAPTRTQGASEHELLQRGFRPELVAKASRDANLANIITERIHEAERCIEVDANLSAVILAGSVLEALCLDFGTRHPERVNRAYSTMFNKPSPRLHEWKLHEWISVLGSTGDLSPNIEKFGHGLRDFRNYVHPVQQWSSGFRPDRHTSVISLHVVFAAVDDLANAHDAIDRRKAS